MPLLKVIRHSWSDGNTDQMKERVPARPRAGVFLGFGVGLVLLLYVLLANPPMIEEEGLTLLDLSLVYLGGGVLSGLVGGLLWPYQRTRLETLVFVVPTAIPVYALACIAIGEPPWLALFAAVVGGVAYSAVYGGEHRNQSEKQDSPAHEGGGNGT